MSGELEELFQGNTATPLDDCRTVESHDINEDKRAFRTAVQASSPASATGAAQETSNHPFPVNDSPKEQNLEGAQIPPPRPATSAGSNPPSSGGARLAPNPLAQATLQSDVQELMTAIPASDPIEPTHHSLDVKFLPSKTGSTKRSKQVQARLDQALRKGQVQPYCQNFGSIETPAWRRA
jgi:hypothetical protein